MAWNLGHVFQTALAGLLFGFISWVLAGNAVAFLLGYLPWNIRNGLQFVWEPRLERLAWLAIFLSNWWLHIYWQLSLWWVVAINMAIFCFCLGMYFRRKRG